VSVYFFSMRPRPDAVSLLYDPDFHSRPQHPNFNPRFLPLFLLGSFVLLFVFLLPHTPLSLARSGRAQEWYSPSTPGPFGRRDDVLPPQPEPQPNRWRSPGYLEHSSEERLSSQAATTTTLTAPHLPSVDELVPSYMSTPSQGLSRWGGVDRIPQEVIVCRVIELYTSLVALLREELHRPNFRVVVYFPTAEVAHAVYRIFQAVGMPVLGNYHESLERNDIENENWRVGSNLVMLSYQAPKGGADHSRTTCVIQIGVSEGLPKYTDRLGRPGFTAQRNLLLLADFEELWLQQLEGFNLKRMAMPEILDSDRRLLKVGMKTLALETLQTDFRCMGHETEPGPREIHNTYIKFIRVYLRQKHTVAAEKGTIIRNANALIMFLYSIPRPPPVLPKNAQKEGLKGCPDVHYGEWQWSWWVPQSTFNLRDYGGW